jgi:ApaG protein
MKSVTTIQKTAPEAPARSMADYAARKRDIPVNSLIEVTVEPYFLPRHSAPLDELFTFGYDVTFRNTGKEPVWLHNRNWLITNEHEKQFDVFGPTVAGRQSIELLPNRKKPFLYKTAVPLDTPSGNMKGYFSGSNGPHGAGAAFVTKEVEFNLSAPNDAVARCLRNRANAEFIDYAEPADLKTLQDLLRGYDKAGEIDTRNLTPNNLATLWEFERLLLKRFLIGYGERAISLHDIHASFPAGMAVWDMAFLAEGGKQGIQIISPLREQKAGAKPSAGYNVVAVDFRKKAIVDNRKALVENHGIGSYNPPDTDQPRFTGEKDVGPMGGPLNDYLKSLGVTQPIHPELVAEIDAFVLRRVKGEVVGHEAAPKLSEAALAAFKAHAKENQWNPESAGSPSAFIKETFKKWLGRGLRLKDIRDGQKNLAGAYSTEVSRDPSKRVKNLIVTLEKLPAGAPRPASSRPVAELSGKEKAEKRQRDAAKMRRWRQSRQEVSL